MSEYNIAIIGGGTSGCIAAIMASQNEKSVILIERNDEIGKKILVTGNSRCNLTNRKIDSSRYHGANPEFIDAVLKSFDQNKTIRYFESLGLKTKEEDNGRIFPAGDKASDVVAVLNQKLKKNNVVVELNSLVRKIEKDKQWKIKLENGKEIIADKLIITTGGKAAYSLGSSGDGYFWAENFGHTITELNPSLVPIEIKEEWIKKVQGVKIVAKISTKLSESVTPIAIQEKTGDVLFTHYGISGPAAMAQGSAVAKNIFKMISINIDLFPTINPNQLDNKIKYIFNNNGAKSIKNNLSHLIPLKLITTLLNNINIDPDKKSAEVSKNDRRKIVKYLKDIVLTPTGTRPFKEAQVTSGGIDVRGINSKTMESKKVSNLYFAGEIIDVDGDSGGFNLQWAWSSGHLAGYSASKTN